HVPQPERVVLLSGQPVTVSVLAAATGKYLAAVRRKDGAVDKILMPFEATDLAGLLFSGGNRAAQQSDRRQQGGTTAARPARAVGMGKRRACLVHAGTLLWVGRDEDSRDSEKAGRFAHYGTGKCEGQIFLGKGPLVKRLWSLRPTLAAV